MLLPHTSHDCIHFDKHGSCPTCRHVFLNIHTPSESDDESSDGGEYIPSADDSEGEDAFLDMDGSSLADPDEFLVEPMEAWGDEDGILDLDEESGDLEDAEMYDGSSEWGLTDGESEPMSSECDHDMTGQEEVSVRGTWPPVLRTIQLIVIALLLFSAGNT